MMILKVIWTIAVVLLAMNISVTPVVAEQIDTTVNIGVPANTDGNFDVTIDIKNVIDLDSGQFDLIFDPSAVNYVGIDDGNIDDTTIAIDSAVEENKIKMLFNLPGLDGVSGSGSLATIHFETITPGDCFMELSDGLLVDTMADIIPANWAGVESTATDVAKDQKPTTPTDPTENQTPGFGALFSISILATAYLVFRK